MNKKLVGISVCIAVLALFTFWFWNVYQSQKDRLCSEASMLFTKAMQEDAKLLIDRQVGFYDSQNSLNDIPEKEKNEWLDQDYLFVRDPNRHVLDSLFRTLLKEQNIQAKTAVRCIWIGKVIDSSADSLLYKGVNLLKPIVYRIDENKEKNITLQAYVDISAVTILTRMGWFLLVFIVLLSLLGAGIFYFPKLRKEIARKFTKSLDLIKRQRKENKLQAALARQKEAELIRLQNQIPILEPEDKINWFALPSGLYFNEKHGDLRDKNQQSVCLTDSSLRLFRCFIKAESYKLSYEDICVWVMECSVKGGINRGHRSRVGVAVSRLRDSLKPFSYIKIEPIRGIGYQMTFSNYQNDTTQPGKSD